jgi:hypothetical protein
MHTKIGLFLCLAAAILAGRLSAQIALKDPPPQKGRVLILDNERTLEGDIGLEGDQYRICRPGGGELWIPRSSVLRLCRNREEAYAYLRAHANLNDADEHLRLGHWCQEHGLRQKAAEEVSAALDLRPDRDTRRWLENLKRPPLVVSVSASQKSPPDNEVDLLQNAPAVSTQSLSLFVTRVQPLLMNVCAGCHANGRGGNFKLQHSYGTTVANRRIVQQNLAAVLAQINRDRPESSPFLIKAVSVHGEMAQPAIKNRETKAFKNLAEWVGVTLANDTANQDSSTMASGAARAGGEPGIFRADNARDLSAGRQGDTAVPPPSGPANPYDPGPFNKQMHPARSEEPKAP